MQKQVFQTNSSRRWKSFVWFTRILVLFLIVISASVVVSLLNKQTYDLKILTYNDKQLPDINEDKSKKIIPNKDQQEFVKQLNKFRKHRPKFYNNDTAKISKHIRKYLPVRAGFYVNWDLNSSASLRKNIDHLNMVIPEWFFQKNKKGDLDSKVDEEIRQFLLKNKVAIVPIVSNIYNGRWNGDSTYHILKNAKSRGKLIQNIVNVLDSNDCKGVNIDFENLPKKIKPYFLKFSKELYETLNPAGYLCTVDIDPSANVLPYKELAKYYDFIFLMAYNEHYPDGPAGSISSLPFVEKSLNEAMKEIPSEKVVLCVAGYGFDWPKGEKGKKISFQGLISLAKEHNESVEFNLSQSDVSMIYTDDTGLDHEAHFNDAVGMFNIIRTAHDYNAAGVALWYLGSEDDRVWNFYSQNLSSEHLKLHPFDITKIENIDASYAINYDGTGEILEMTNEPDNGHTKLEYDSNDHLIVSEKYLDLPSSYLLKRYGSSNKMKLAITFDDGPDNEFTPKILDVLKQKNVKATFFVTGANIENNIPLIRRIYREGHEIGNHTFTHPNLEITSENRERMELRSTRLLLESILGKSTLLFRPPYNTDAEPRNLFQIKPISIAKDEGFISVTSYIDPNDWEENVTADSIVARAIANQAKGNVILLHDAGGERIETIKALPRIIDYFKENGFEFVTISGLMNKSRDQVMPQVENKFKITHFLDLTFFTLTFLWDHFLHGFFIVAILLIVFRMIMIAILAITQQLKERKKKEIGNNTSPKVSIIVPAYNEEVNAVRTINHLLQSDYPNFEICFIDDGSTDNTFQLISSTFANNPNVKAYKKENGGKASALNFGIEHSSGEILVCIDADTMLKSDAISKMIPYFGEENVGAVAGNVRVGNAVNTLTYWQSIEYTTSQNFDRRAYDALNSILVVPGAIGAFHREAMEKAGGFTTDTLAEDCDLTIRILRSGYKIRTSNDALAFTEAPETSSMFIKQRIRWTFGMMQTLWKHKDLLLNLKKINIGWVVLPNLLIYNFIIPVFSPVVDILFIAGLFTQNALIYTLMYVMYYLLDCLISWLAFSYDKKKFTLKTAGYLFIQRFIYRQMLFYVLFKAYMKAIKGELVIWGFLKRTGNIKD